MTVKNPAPRRSACPLNASLEAIGDQWSLLIVRDLLLKNRSRYGEFLNAEEGVSTNILADRLRRLETHGIVDSRPDPSDARKRVYRLTPKGRELAPILVELIIWGARHHRTDASPTLIDQMEDDRETFLASLSPAGGEHGSPPDASNQS